MDKPVACKAAGGESADLISDKCYICLSAFENQTVGSLENCQHFFCLQCILQWSQTANTCPVDRTSFAFIYQRRCPGGDIQKKIKVRTKKNNDDDEERNNPVICEECGRSDRRHRMLVCLCCDSGYHMDCLTPPISTSPEDDWICPECEITPRQTESSVLEEISDGELTDLLAEVDETPSTSSRFRPSTVNRSSSSYEQWQSARIQTRASSSSSQSSSHRPQTSWHVPKYLLRAVRPTVPTAEDAEHGDPSSASVNVKARQKRKRTA